MCRNHTVGYLKSNIVKLSILLQKEMSSCNKLLFSNFYIFASRCRMTYDNSDYEFCKIKYSKFEISKVFIIRLDS